MKRLLSIFFVLFMIVFISKPGFTQDAAEVDPDHYKVEFENDEVRVLRITYDAGEKSVMHSHPEGVVVFLSEGSGRFTYPDGKTEDMEFNSGLTIWTPAITHQPENTGEGSFEIIQIEMKTKKD